MQIRPIAIEDAEQISRIRRLDGVREGILAVTSERLDVTVNFIKSLSDDDRAFVAVEKKDEIAGMAVIVKNKCFKRRHSAMLAIMVAPYYQEKGIGTALMKRLLDEADKKLFLRRIELLVLTDNTPAINLYKKFGFKIEATRKNAAVKDGRFVDEYFMGRINKKGDSLR
ncbi:MAG: GNAT family N-acetyltransferase [Synergistaceae bacterium]|nr:GNAT family N-acetyltransferase [Synergistaceae bacterium]